MSPQNHNAAAAATLGGAETGIRNAGPGTIQFAIIAKCRAVFHVKTWAKLVEILGISERVAKHRMAGTREFTADELARLLHSEHGFEFLVAVMGEQKPKWWRLVVPLMEVAEVQRMQIAVRRKLKRAVEGAIDADRDITAALAIAAALPDQDFHREHVDSLRAVAGIQIGTVAAATKTGRR